MTEFLMTSTIPYWELFTVAALTTLAYLSASKAGDNAEVKSISYRKMLIVSGMSIFSAVGVIVIYSIVGGDALWWILGDHHNYFGKLVRLIPLLAFLGMQGWAPFGYKKFMQAFLKNKELSVKNQFIALVVLVPVAIVIFMVLNSFLSESVSRIIFYLLTIGAVAGAFIYSLKKNVGFAGKKYGMIYTITSTILCIATLFTLLYTVIAVMSLILEMLPVIATCIGISYIFGKNFGSAVTSQAPNRNFIADDGSRHETSTSRDFRNKSLNNQK